MQLSQFGKSQRGHSEQETPQGGWVGISGYPGEILKDSILFQEVRRFDPSQSQRDGINQRQHLLGNRVAIVALEKMSILGQKRAEIDLLKKPLDQI